MMTIVVTESARDDLRETLFFYRAPSRASEELSSSSSVASVISINGPSLATAAGTSPKPMCFWF